MAAQPKRARGRLIVQRPPPPDWRPGWTPANPVRRCGCGAPIVVRSVRFSRCERGCTRVPAPPLRPTRTPPPPPPPPPDPRYDRLWREIRQLEGDFRAQTLRGRRPTPAVMALALRAVDTFKGEFPHRAAEIAAAFPWFEAQRARGAGRAA